MLEGGIIARTDVDSRSDLPLELAPVGKDKDVGVREEGGIVLEAVLVDKKGQSR